MIFLGYGDEEKDAAILSYCGQHGIRKVFVFSPARFRFTCSHENAEQIEWAEIIKYKFFYRLLQEIGNDSLVVISECLRTQNRYDLTYNCLRQYLNQTRHQLVFQYFPMIDTLEDFMILFDFDTRSKWKREKFSAAPIEECRIKASELPIALTRQTVPTPSRVMTEYQAEKRKLIDGIGQKDPDTIPRNLLLMAGKAKLHCLEPSAQYVARNNRFKLPNLTTYKEDSYAGAHAIFEFCHDFITFSDFLCLTGQREFTALVSELKVDHWYFDRFEKWGTRLRDACAALRR